MWFEWLVRRCDMGALAVDSPLQPPFDVDQEGSEYTISQCAHDATSLWSRQKAERKVLMPCIFHPTLPLSGLPIAANELVSSPMWSPSFDNNPCKDLGYHALGGLKTLSVSLLGDASIEGGPWMSEPFNQLTKNYLQTVQELKQSSFSHCQEAPLQPERYKELKARFWKRLATDSLNNEPCNFACMSGAQASEVRVEGGNSPSNYTVKKTIFSELQASNIGRGGSGLNGLVEIEVVLTGKWNALLSKEATMNPNQELVALETQEVATILVQNEACMKDIQFSEELNLPLQDGIDQSFDQSFGVEKDRDDDVCRIGASSREASDKESLEGHNVASHESNPLQHQEQQELQQSNGSECSFDSGRGIGRGRIGKDGSPTSTSSNRQTQEASKTSIRNVEFNKNVDETFWSTTNWCVVDSYMTGHGKETTWTIRGFEEDDDVFEGNLPKCKDMSPLKIFADEMNLSPFSDLLATQFLPIEVHDVETQHGPPPKWTKQALQEQVAKNLMEQHNKVRSSKNGLETVRSLANKHTMEGMDIEDGKTIQREVVLDDLTSISDMLYCRKGGKSMHEAILNERRDKVGGGDVEASQDVNGIESASWKSVRHSSNACIGMRTFKSNQDKELLNLATRQKIRRCKRGWAKRKAQPSATTVACCMSMIGDTIQILQRTQEDALKLAEFQATELKTYKAAASAMCIHIDLLQLEVQELEIERKFNALVAFPWGIFLRNVVFGISLVSGTLGLHCALKSLFRLLFGQVVQTSTSRKEKTIVAVVILSSGNYVGKEMWQLFSQVQARKERNETAFQDKLHLVCKRLSHMSTLTYKNGIVHQRQAEDANKML